MKKLLALLLVLFLVGSVVFYSLKVGKKPNDEGSPQSNNNEAERTMQTDSQFLLEGFPIQTVPLFKMSSISSSRFYYNDDPATTSFFDERPFSYFNVVFKSTATQQEVFDYYKERFTEEIIREYPSADTITGKINEYKIVVRHYGSDDTVYLEAYLPAAQVTKDTTNLKAIPFTLLRNEYLEEHELSYGLLNQKGGEIEHTQYFTIRDTGDRNKDGKDDVNEFELLLSECKDAYKSKENYKFEEKSQQLTWKDGDYSITVSFSYSHDRVYVMIRKPL